jgi:hypothetical protein
MKLCRTLFCGVVGAVFITAKLFAAGVASTNNVVTSPPVYVPDTSHANEPMPDGVLAWNSLMQNTNAAADQAQAHFFFSFTNIATVPSVNFLTNAEGVTAITNTTPVSVTILDVHPSCGCTTVELPPRPWTIPPGGHGEFGVTVNLEGKIGTLLKAVTVSTDKGSKDLLLRITILPPVIPNMTDADRARGVTMSKADRQAVFKDDCATCHVKPGEGKYGKAHVDCPWQGWLAHARVLDRRGRPAQRHANRLARRLFELRDSVARHAGAVNFACGKFSPQYAVNHDSDKG